MVDYPDPSNLHEKARAVLWAVYSNNGKADTSQIRERAGFSPQLINYHIDALLDHDLVEKVGKRDVGKPSKANVYKLTDGGTAIAEVIGGDPLEGPDLQVAIRRIESRLDALEESVAVINELEGDVADLKEGHNNIADYLRAKEKEERDDRRGSIPGSDQY